MAARTDMELALANIGNNTRSLTSPRSSKFIDDDSQHIGTFQAVLAITDAVVDVTDCVFGSSMETYDADFTLPKGVTIYGSFETLSLESGSVIAYKL
tara:strand:- start:2839 stop:3129 length:291 start_codon:yes stop_codon:yes gene_type:complete